MIQAGAARMQQCQAYTLLSGANVWSFELRMQIRGVGIRGLEFVYGGGHQIHLIYRSSFIFPSSQVRRKAHTRIRSTLRLHDSSTCPWVLEL